MRKTHEIVKERLDKQAALNQMTSVFKKEKGRISVEIASLLELEHIAQSNFNIESVQIAESLISVQGNPYGSIDQSGSTIAVSAINDIANDFKVLRTIKFGNKRYEGFYQRCDCTYGMGPRHGSVVDSIGLNDRTHEFTDDEKDACIYYLKNYTAIKEAKKQGK